MAVFTIAFWGPPRSGKTWLKQAFIRQVDLLNNQLAGQNIKLSLTHKEDGVPVHPTFTKETKKQITTDVWKFRRDHPQDPKVSYEHLINVYDAPGEEITGPKNTTNARIARNLIKTADLLILTLGGSVETPEAWLQYLEDLRDLLQDSSITPKKIAVCLTKADQLLSTPRQFDEVNKNPEQILPLFQRRFGEETGRRMLALLEQEYSQDGHTLQLFVTSAFGFFLDADSYVPNYKQATRDLADRRIWAPFKVETPYFWFFEQMEKDEIGKKQNLKNVRKLLSRPVQEENYIPHPLLKSHFQKTGFLRTPVTETALTYFQLAGFDIVYKGIDVFAIRYRKKNRFWDSQGEVAVFCDSPSFQPEFVHSCWGKTQELGVSREWTIVVYEEQFPGETGRTLWEYKNKGFRIIPLHLLQMKEILSSSRRKADDCYDHLRAEIEVWSSFLNPYDLVNPYDDPQWFFGRKKLLMDIRQQSKVPGARPQLIYGMRRVGKTAFVNQLVLRYKSEGIPIVLLKCKKYETLPLMLYDITMELASQLQLKDGSSLKIGESEIYEKKSERQFREDFIRLLNAYNGDHPIMLIVDEFELNGFIPGERSPEFVYERYRRFAEILVMLLEEAPFRRHIALLVTSEFFWANAIDYFPRAQGQEMQNPLYQRFTVLPLELIQETDVKTMIKSIGNLAGLSFTSEALDYLYILTKGHPQVILKLCGCFMPWLEENKRYNDQITEQDVEQVAHDFLTSTKTASYRELFQHSFWENFTSPDRDSDKRVMTELAKHSLLIGKQFTDEFELHLTLEHKRQDLISRLEESAERLCVTKAIEIPGKILQEKSEVYKFDNFDKKEKYQITLPIYRNWIRVEKLKLPIISERNSK